MTLTLLECAGPTVHFDDDPARPRAGLVACHRVQTPRGYLGPHPEGRLFAAYESTEALDAEAVLARACAGHGGFVHLGCVHALPGDPSCTASPTSTSAAASGC